MQRPVSAYLPLFHLLISHRWPFGVSHNCTIRIGLLLTCSFTCETLDTCRSWVESDRTAEEKTDITFSARMPFWYLCFLALSVAPSWSVYCSFFWWAQEEKERQKNPSEGENLTNKSFTGRSWAIKSIEATAMQWKKKVLHCWPTKNSGWRNDIVLLVVIKNSVCVSKEGSPRNQERFKANVANPGYHIPSSPIHIQHSCKRNGYHKFAQWHNIGRENFDDIMNLHNVLTSMVILAVNAIVIVVCRGLALHSLLLLSTVFRF